LNVVHGEEERTAVEMGGLGERGGGHRLAGDVDTVLVARSALRQLQQDVWPSGHGSAHAVGSPASREC
jgi:hypothetical protein